MIAILKKSVFKAFFILLLTCLAQVLLLAGASRLHVDAEVYQAATGRYSEGQDIAPGELAGAVSLSAGQKLELDDKYYLFFSNVPEFPLEKGILCRSDDVLSSSGLVRVLFSHMNLLIDYSQAPYIENMPAVAGFSVENKTGRTLDVYAVRSGIAVNLDVEGVYHFTEDAAPVRPGDSEPLYYGTAVGNYVARQWFLSEGQPPVLLGSAAPGERVIVSQPVGARGWVSGIYDLRFTDHATGRQVVRESLKSGERVGLATFLASMDDELDSFIKYELNRGRVLPPRNNDVLHMRGLFRPGLYHDNPHGEAVSKGYTIVHNSVGGVPVSFALAAGENDQSQDPEQPCYVPDVFLNDNLRNGHDPYSERKKGVNGGNYGVDYTIKMKLTGPMALVMQGATHEGATSDEFIDLNNQIITFSLDGAVKTVMLRDPNYDLYYIDRSLIRSPGYGKVVAVFNSTGRHDHLLRFTLPPNGYGPVRFFLMPFN